jgi:hypothetical protein
MFAPYYLTLHHHSIALYASPFYCHSAFSEQRNKRLPQQLAPLELKPVRWHTNNKSLFKYELHLHKVRLNITLTAVHGEPRNIVRGGGGVNKFR